MKKIFISSPFRGDVERNRKTAAGYCRIAYEVGHLPIAPHLLFPQFLDEDNLKERTDGISMGLDLLRDCDELWMFGKATEGMEQESGSQWSMVFTSGLKKCRRGDWKNETGANCY